MPTLCVTLRHQMPIHANRLDGQEMEFLCMGSVMMPMATNSTPAIHLHQDQQNLMSSWLQELSNLLQMKIPINMLMQMDAILMRPMELFILQQGNIPIS